MPASRATTTVVGVAVAMTVTMGAINYGLFPGSQELGGMLFGRQLPHSVADGPVPGGAGPGGTAPGELPPGEPTGTPEAPSPSAQPSDRALATPRPAEGVPGATVGTVVPQRRAGAAPDARSGASAGAPAADAPAPGAAPARPGSVPQAGTGTRTGGGQQPVAPSSARQPAPTQAPTTTGSTGAAPTAAAPTAGSTGSGGGRIERGQPAQGLRPPTSSTIEQETITPLPEDEQGDDSDGGRKGDTERGSGSGEPTAKPRPSTGALKPGPSHIDAREKPKKTRVGTSSAMPTPAPTAPATPDQQGQQDQQGQDQDGQANR
ncbi:hypothetical protein [Enemella evansiae]|uniref:hypothetical protein n=1 Tax=Enemella evansiae TaxID=2016499 RepID=UPI000B96A2B4|nr:hypothetical protein [Enemella evansiae]OYO05779.1 hypothetical protein CGZ97_03530 [Enemella evansiae]OYO20144.1 hypothetical protein BI335_00825 [Enemella evansiae]